MRIVVLDTETAGLSPSDGVVEVAIIEIDKNLNILAQHYSRIDPEGPISPSASGVHGIVSADVQDAPTLAQFFDMPGLRDYCTDDLIVIGHNIQFDIRFLADHLKGNNLPVCTLRLARTMYPDAENHKLQTLRYWLDLASGAAHNALGDTLVCLSLLERMLMDDGGTLQELVDVSTAPLKVHLMPFGKYKGQPLKKLPVDYVTWLLGREIDEDLRFSLGTRSAE